MHKVPLNLMGGNGNIAVRALPKAALRISPGGSELKPQSGCTTAGFSNYICIVLKLLQPTPAHVTTNPMVGVGCNSCLFFFFFFFFLKNY